VFFVNINVIHFESMLITMQKQLGIDL